MRFKDWESYDDGIIKVFGKHKVFEALDKRAALRLFKDILELCDYYGVSTELITDYLCPKLSVCIECMQYKNLYKMNYCKKCYGE